MTYAKKAYNIKIEKTKEWRNMRDELIKARGNKSQTEVANVIGISQKYLSKLELEKRNPSIVIASKLSKYYRKSVEELFPDIFLKQNTP